MFVAPVAERRTILTMTEQPGDERGEATPASPDGRALRRSRNIDAVRSAILELLTERKLITMELIAERADVAVRSIYRYFGDLEGAIDDAFQLRLVEVTALRDSFRVPPPEYPFEERLEELLDQRFALERAGRPMRDTRQYPNPDLRFDEHVRATFAPELAKLSDEDREQAGSVAAWVVRPRTIRSHIQSGEDEALTRRIVRFAVLAALKQN